MRKKVGAKKPFAAFCAAALVASLCMPTAALADIGGGSAAAGTEAAAAQTPAVQSADTGVAVQDAGANVAAIGDTSYATLQAAIDAANNGDVIRLLADVHDFAGATISKNITFDFGDYTVYGPTANVVSRVGVLKVENCQVTLNAASGGIDGGSGGNIKTIWACSGSKVVINGGHYTVGPDADGLGNSTVEAEDGGNVIINNGEFSSKAAYNNFYYVLNYKNDRPGKIEVYGGTFEKQDPAKGDDNLGGSFLGYGAVSKDNGNGTYTVSQLPRVAEVGGSQYVTLADAIDAAKDGETVKVLADCEVNATIGIAKKVTVDLDGKTVTGVNNGKGVRVFQVLGGGDLSLVSTAAEGDGKVTTASGLDVESSVIRVGEGAAEGAGTGAKAVYRQGDMVSVSAPSSYGITVFGSTSEEVTIGGPNNSWVTSLALANDNYDGCAISTVGTDITPANITIGYASIYSQNSNAIYMPSGSLTLKDGAYVNGTTGLYVKSGETVIESANITGHGEKKQYNYNGNGGVSTGDALVVDNCGYPTGAPKVTVNGGCFESSCASAVGSYATSGNDPLAGFIYGGAFSTQPNASYIANDYVAVGAGGYFEVVKKQASAGDKEGKTEGSVAVAPSDISPAISDASANALAGTAASVSKSLKGSGKLPDDIEVDAAGKHAIDEACGAIEAEDAVSTVLVVSANSSSRRDSKIEGALADGEEACYIDLSVYLQLTVLDADGVVKGNATAEVAQLPSDVEVTVAVDPEFIEGKDVKVARNHGGEVDFITPTKVDSTTGAVTFKTDRFSSYAVVASEPAAVYEVRFVDKFNGTESLQQVESGKTAVKPADPSFAGYEFAGWFTDEAATGLYDFGTPVTGGLTLYAGYKKAEPAPAGGNGQAGDGNGGKAAEAPAATALAQTGDNAAPVALGAVALGALLVVAGAFALRRRSQR